MKCEGPRSTVIGTLGGVIALISAAIAAMVIAAIFNKSIFVAAAAPAWVATAASFAGAASLGVGAAILAHNAFSTCVVRAGGSTTACRGSADITNLLNGLLAATLAAGVTLLVAIVPAAAPWWGLAWILAGTASLITALGLALKAMDDFRGWAVCTQRTIPLTAENVRFFVATCPLNKATCSAQQMRRALPSSTRTPVFSTSLSFAVLVQEHGLAAISSLAATVEDSFQKTVSVHANDILPPRKHQIFDPSYWAVVLDWAKLSPQGIGVGPSAAQRRWKVTVIVTLADGSQSTFAVEVLVST